MALSVSIGKLTKLLIITVKGDGVVGFREGLVEGLAIGGDVGLVHVLGGVPAKALLSTIGDPAMRIQEREEQPAKA